MHNPPEIDRLQAEIEAATDERDRFELLLKLANATHLHGLQGGSAIAERARMIAESLGEKRLTARAFQQQGRCMKSEGDRNEAVGLIEKAIALIESIGDDAMLAAALHDYASALDWASRHVEAYAALERSADLHETLQTPGYRLRYLSLRSTILYHVGDSQGQMESAFQLREAASDAGDEEWITDSINRLAIAYEMMGDNETSLRYFEELLQRYPIEKNRHRHLITLGNIGHVNGRLHRFEAALEYFNHVLSLLGDEDAPHMAAATLAQMAVALSSLDRFREAIEAASRTMQIAASLGAVEHESHALGIMGLAHARLGEFDRGIELLSRALEIEESNNQIRNIAELSRSLSSIYEAVGDSERALAMLHKSNALFEEVRGMERQRAVAQLEMRTAIEHASKERQLLKQRNELLESEMQRKDAQLAAMALSLVEKGQVIKAIKSDVEEVAQQVDGTARRAMRSLARQIDGSDADTDAWRAFELQFEQVHSGFLGRLSERYPELSRTELKVCALLKIGMSTKEIAEVLRSSDRTIGNHRYRIRKKLDISEETPFHSFFSTI